MNKQPNYLGIIVLVAVGFWLYNQKPDSKPEPVVTVESATKAVFPATAKGYAAAFEDAAKQVEASKFKYARELLEYLKPLTTQARIDAQKPFDVTLGTQIPDEIAGHEVEVAALLRRVAKSWK